MAAAPPPIPGEYIDRPPKSQVATLERIEGRSEIAGVGFRAFVRFAHARTTVLAAGTTYYIFLAMFALLTLAFGLAARFGAARVSAFIEDALSSAFPGLTQPGAGLDAANLERVGASVSLIGLLVLLFSGSGAMVAASDSFHLIYGAPKDGRNVVLARLRLLGWMLLLAPLILISFAASLLVTTLAGPILDFFGSTSTAGQILLQVGTRLASLIVGFIVVYLMSGHLGGIRPPRRARLIGAAVAAVAIEILKAVMSLVVAWSISKPQYGAFAAPITVLLVLYLLTVVTYLSAALTAALAETSGAAVTVPDPGDPQQRTPAQSSPAG